MRFFPLLLFITFPIRYRLFILALDRVLCSLATSLSTKPPSVRIILLYLPHSSQPRCTITATVMQRP
jgi:hypothetical protein